MYKVHDNGIFKFVQTVYLLYYRLLFFLFGFLNLILDMTSVVYLGFLCFYALDSIAMWLKI